MQVHKSETQKKTQVDAEEMHKRSCPTYYLQEGPTNLRKWAPQARCTQGSTPGPTYQFSRRRQAWGAPFGLDQPPTGPKQAHLLPADSHRTAYASPGWFHLGSSLKDPPLEGYIRRRRAPPFNTQQEEQSSTPRRSPTFVVLRNGERE